MDVREAWIVSTSDQPLVDRSAQLRAMTGRSLCLDRVVIDEIERRWRAAAEAIGPVLAETLRALAPAVEQASRALSDMAKSLREMGLLDEAPPTEPQARALWLRQHRSTGPATRQRPPRSIHARRSR
ncbi:hypothetical protein [Saccharothrix lopnurensis]|uniref:PIN domain-containing protein n=1 Tax=Saccharothrix lopnurensis TaxID=1670621 RepID=A0ABW1P298_9PSEU